ncbi:teichuronic acid biosynthesis glycosyltransferase TuaH [Kibdelosporangium banguiense]|uniref:Teichuronic acid biosynthesis glycosyltransferase TuaH n=1 Tax=Kibdelosporangium banguiense TaxID=1365924 RepID=A0ABS4TEH7_9PSEU|nr:glycosyltransferase [Kibdelosporangium banguiense]MBP2322241.1 teichuronic acid biosynthesis glycosyltransferase TuaH [Kibdelosporangium banguiense]
MRPLVVVASGVTWDGVKGSERQLAESLARHTDILWVDPPVSPVTPARFRGKSGRMWRPLLRSAAPRIARLTPVGPPGWTRPGVREFTWPIVRAQIAWALRKARRRPAVFIACTQHDLLGRWGEQVVDVLYGTDDWVAGASLMNQDANFVLREERKAIARADLVLAVGPELADRWQELGAQPVVFPNGCDPEAYQAVADPGPVPGGFPNRVAGLIGQLSDRIDIELLESVADSGIGLLLVGPREPGWQPGRADALLKRPNVHYVGAVPFEELPQWFARIDVGLTPYADTVFNRASFPLKTLEYLAAGLPVVSTDLPASRRLAEESSGIQLAGDRRAFADAVVKAAIDKAEPDVVAQRRSVAARHSWAARAETFTRLAGLSA